MKHEGIATSFERLDREILALRRRVSLSSLYSWNFEAKLCQDVPPTLPMPPADCLTGWEIGALVLSVCMLLASCKEEEHVPERSDPFRPPRPAVRVLGAQELQDGSFVIMLTKESL